MILTPLSAVACGSRHKFRHCCFCNRPRHIRRASGFCVLTEIFFWHAAQTCTWSCASPCPVRTHAGQRQLLATGTDVRAAATHQFREGVAWGAVTHERASCTRPAQRPLDLARTCRVCRQTARRICACIVRCRRGCCRRGGGDGDLRLSSHMFQVLVNSQLTPALLLHMTYSNRLVWPQQWHTQTRCADGLLLLHIQCGLLARARGC